MALETGLDLYSVQQYIAALVRDKFPNYKVYEDEMLDDESILKLGTFVEPYLVLRWSKMNRAFNGASFGGVRHDEYFSSVDVCVVSSMPKASRKIMNNIFGILAGEKIGNTRLSPDPGNTGFATITDNAGIPHAYVASERFSFAVNSRAVGEYITP